MSHQYSLRINDTGAAQSGHAYRALHDSSTAAHCTAARSTAPQPQAGCTGCNPEAPVPACAHMRTWCHVVVPVWCCLHHAKLAGPARQLHHVAARTAASSGRPRHATRRSVVAAGINCRRTRGEMQERKQQAGRKINTKKTHGLHLSAASAWCAWHGATQGGTAGMGVGKVCTAALIGCEG